MSAPIIVTIGIAVVVFSIILIYNGIIRRSNDVDNAFAGMDVQLKKRYDLIPNLVKIVKQYALHEKELLTQLTEMRAKAISAGLDNTEKMAIDSRIVTGMSNIMVAVENYPELKASENFLTLQRSLNEVEAQISAARRTYNAVVTDYNNGIQTFPQNIMAAFMKMTRKEVFEIPETERQHNAVKDII